MIICFCQVQHTIENIRVFYSSSSSSFPSEVIISSMTDLSTQNLLFAFKKRSIASESGSMWLLRCNILSFALLKRRSQIFEVLETCKVERYKDLSARCLLAESLSCNYLSLKLVKLCNNEKPIRWSKVAIPKNWYSFAAL